MMIKSKAWGWTVLPTKVTKRKNSDVVESATERRWPVQGAGRGQRTWTYGPFSTLMERILLKPLSMMFWHSSMNSQRFPWKFSSSHTVILNWPICSICWVFMAAASPEGLYNLEWWEKWKRQQRVDGCDQRGITDIPPNSKVWGLLLFRKSFFAKVLFHFDSSESNHFQFYSKVFFSTQFWKRCIFCALIFIRYFTPHSDLVLLSTISTNENNRLAKSTFKTRRDGCTENEMNKYVSGSNTGPLLQHLPASLSQIKGRLGCELTGLPRILLIIIFFFR